MGWNDDHSDDNNIRKTMTVYIKRYYHEPRSIKIQKSPSLTLYVAAFQALGVRDQMTTAFELEKSGPAKSYSHPFLTSPILLAFSEIIASGSLLT